MSIITRINKAEKRIVDLYNKLNNSSSGGELGLEALEELYKIKHFTIKIIF